MNIKNKELKKTIIQENANQKVDRAFLVQTAESDPTFFRWLFDATEWDDFDCPKVAQEAWGEFLAEWED